MEQLPLPPGGTDATGDRPHRPDPTQSELPFGDADEQPVAFALTARARRTVAPSTVPRLRLVAPRDGDPAVGQAPAETAVEEDERTDTRPARARALRRAGTRPAAIAEQLGVDPLLVRAWTDGVRGVAHVTTVPVGEGDPVVSEDATRRAAFASARTSARRRARARLLTEPQLGGGLGVLAAVAEVEPDAVTVTTRDERVAATVLRWTAQVLDVGPDRWRVVIRLGERVAADLARHRWAAALSVPPERVRITRWAGAADGDGEEARLRLADPPTAAAVAGWRDALLDDPEDPRF